MAHASPNIPWTKESLPGQNDVQVLVEVNPTWWLEGERTRIFVNCVGIHTVGKILKFLSTPRLQKKLLRSCFLLFDEVSFCCSDWTFDSSCGILHFSGRSRAGPTCATI